MAKDQPFAHLGLIVPTTHVAGGALPIPGGRTRKNQPPSVRGLESRIINQMQRNLLRLGTHVSEGGLATDEDIEAGETWYPTGQEHSRRIGAMLDSTQRVGASLISSLSPQTEWERNLIRAHDIALHGRPTHPMGHWGESNISTDPSWSPDDRIRKARAIMDHAQEGGLGEGRFNISMRSRIQNSSIVAPAMKNKPVFSEGLKTHNFQENLDNPLDPRWVTVDTHAHNAGVGSITSSALTGLSSIGRYNIFAQAYHGAARELGIHPQEAQARIWTAWKRINPMPQSGASFDDYLKSIGHYDRYYGM